jgi:putative transposase
VGVGRSPLGRGDTPTDGGHAGAEFFGFAPFIGVPRKPRQEFAGAMHHVFARGNNKQTIFSDDGDCQVYLVLLKGVVAVYGWSVLSYCLMTNHVHLVVLTPYPNLGSGMQRLHGHYGRYYNRRHQRSGHLFTRPYGVKGIASDRQLLATLLYIARNPVDAGLCAAPPDWLRSSHAASIGLADDPCLDLDCLHAYFPAAALSVA